MLCFPGKPIARKKDPGLANNIARRNIVFKKLLPLIVFALLGTAALPVGAQKSTSTPDAELENAIKVIGQARNEDLAEACKQNSFNCYVAIGSLKAAMNTSGVEVYYVTPTPRPSDQPEATPELDPSPLVLKVGRALVPVGQQFMLVDGGFQWRFTATGNGEYVLQVFDEKAGWATSFSQQQVWEAGRIHISGYEPGVGVTVYISPG